MMLLSSSYSYDCLKHDRMLTLGRLNTRIQNQDARVTHNQAYLFFIEIILDIKGRKNISMNT